MLTQNMIHKITGQMSLLPNLCQKSFCKYPRNFLGVSSSDWENCLNITGDISGVYGNISFLVLMQGDATGIFASAEEIYQILHDAELEIQLHMAS